MKTLRAGKDVLTLLHSEKWGERRNVKNFQTVYIEREEEEGNEVAMPGADTEAPLSLSGDATLTITEGSGPNDTGYKHRIRKLCASYEKCNKPVIDGVNFSSR